jgi:hypothetical protein
VNPLPVELIEFTGEMIAGKAKLSWMTASETGNDFFEVQSSVDGEQFRVIGIVDGSGDSDEVLTYGFTHDVPVVGSNYYRLRQVDFDGEFEYSEIIRLENTTEQSNIRLEITPNPTTYTNIGLLIDPMDVDQRVRITLVDSFGRVLLEVSHDEEINFEDLIQLKTPVLSSGLYFVVVEQGSYIVKEKLIIR